MNLKRFFQMLLFPSAIIAAGGAFAQGVVVYKHIDEAGRVTYSNQPIKGAVVVELSPLTVLPKSQVAQVPQAAKTPSSAIPVGVSVQGVVSREENPPTNSQEDPPRDSPTAATPQQVVPSQSPPLAVVTSKPPQNARNPQMSMAANPQSSTGMNAAMIAKQRREDVRRRILEGEIEAEAQLLSEAQSDLQREQAKSVAMRSLRTAIMADEKAMAGKRQLSDDTLATKMVVERHFERVRELQDQVAMHEENLAELRSQLRSTPQTTVMKSAQLKPTSTPVRTAPPLLR